MVEGNQDLNNIKNEPTVSKQLPKSQRGIIVILLVLVIVLFSIVVYFLIKDEIVQLPFLNTQQDNLEDVEEEIDKKESLEDDETEVGSGGSNDEGQLDSSVEKEEAEDVDTSNWLTYQLDNPKLTFKYPNGYTVTLVPTNDEELIHLQISGARESFNYYMFYGEGGPGSGTVGEIEPPESIRMIGKFLGGDIYEIKNGEFYKYFSYIEKCSLCLAEEGYSPGCPCTSSDNYRYNSMFQRNLEWAGVGEKETFIEIEIKGTMSDYDKNVYENILLSFQKT
jgi:hypothetical protein